MRETTRARQAWNDYEALGADRSLEKLVGEYRNRTDKAPSRQLSRLKAWSVAFGWQARLVAIAEVERQSIVRRGIRDRQNRVDALDEMAGHARRLFLARDATDSVSVGLLREYRAHLQQVAQELGEWVEKREQTNREPAALKAYRQEDLDLLEG